MLKNNLRKGERVKKEIEVTDRRKEVVDTCLNTFVAKGLYNTSVRDLSKAIKSSSSGIYYWFEDKDKAVVACAEEAAHRLENALIIPALKETANPDKMIEHIFTVADKMAPMMKFFVQVCATPEYQESMKAVLDRLTIGYEKYTSQFAERIGCADAEMKPYVYMCITAMTNYMVFGERDYIVPQMELVKNKLNELLRK